MGVYGLEVFMENNSLTSEVNIGSLATHFQQSENKTPVLLIDFPTFFGPIYMTTGLDKMCGGQNKEFVFYLKQLMGNFEKFGIKCIFFCDANPTKIRRQLWLNRRRRKTGSANDAMLVLDATTDVADLKNQQEMFNQSRCPATGAWFSAMNYLRSVNVQLIQTTHEADQEIISYCKREKCFGVLAQEPDFAIAEGVLHYFSTKCLNISTLDTIEYLRDGLIEKLSLDASLLPIFASMCGNDDVDFKALCNFHCGLIGIPKDVHFHKSLLPCLKIADWIKKHSRHVDLIKKPEKVAHLLNLGRISENFRASVENYLYGADGSSFTLVLSGDRGWDAILRETNVKMRHQYQSPKIHGVIVSQNLFSSIYLQYYFHDFYPCDELVGSKIRRKFYGILLKEHPQSATVQVTEFAFVSSGIRGFKSIAPIFPAHHPGLLTMWSDQGNLDEKWRMLAWAVGEDVPLDLVRGLPEPLQISTLALFYITHESGLLETWEAYALAMQAVLLLQMSPSELGKLECVCQDAVAVHLASVYQSMSMWVSYVADACGNPTCLFRSEDSVVFDGKLFHSIYLSFKNNGNFDFYLNKMTGQEAEWLQQMEAIIRN